MSTNIYMRRVVPRMVPEYDKIHVAKLSGGWRAHFDGSSAHDPSTDEHAPRVGSVDDLRAYLGTGEWELVDEYGDPTTLDDVLAHDAVTVNGQLWNTRENPTDYHDREGHPWSRREFS